MLEHGVFCGDGDDVSHDNDDDVLSSFFGRKMLPGVVFVHDDSDGLIAFCIIDLEREEREKRDRRETRDERERESCLVGMDW